MPRARKNQEANTELPEGGAANHQPEKDAPQAKPEAKALLEVNAQDKEGLLFALDVCARKLGEDISKLGINSVQDGGMKLFAIRDLALKVDRLKLE